MHYLDLLEGKGGTEVRAKTAVAIAVHLFPSGPVLEHTHEGDIIALLPAGAGVVHIAVGRDAVRIGIELGTLEANALVHEPSNPGAELVERRTQRSLRTLRAFGARVALDTRRAAGARRTLRTGNTLRAWLTRRTRRTRRANRASSARRARLARNTVDARLARNTRRTRRTRAGLEVGNNLLEFVGLLNQFVLDFLSSLLHTILIIRNHFLLAFHEIVRLLVLALDFLDKTLKPKYM
mmetsp:Transcript_40006/g.107056  ORF Transcript_40006/g.107056 Transcript_40006/m.107056 type:complete len:237 (+) Transcript_40006:480-1190(+)